jgi:four helix bundle protein
LATLQREDRTKTFAIQIIRFVAKLPKSRICDALGHQLVKSGTSIGANYREANRAESRADVTHKIGIVEKECSESLSWRELCEESDIGEKVVRSQLRQECGELLALFTSIGKSTKARTQLNYNVRESVRVIHPKSAMRYQK